MTKYICIIITLATFVTGSWALTVKHYSLEGLSKDSPFIVRAKCTAIAFGNEAGIEKKIYRFEIHEVIKGNFGKKNIELKMLKNAEKLRLVPSIEISDEAVLFLSATLKIKGITQGYLKLHEDIKTKKRLTSYENTSYTYEALKKIITSYTQ